MRRSSAQHALQRLCLTGISFVCRNYHYSKLANVLFTQEFNTRHHTPGGVTAFVLHPGVIDTGLGRHGGCTNFLLYRVGALQRTSI